MARISHIACATLAALLAGCAHVSSPSPPSPSGSASWHAVVPEGTARYQLAMGEVSSGAAPDKRVEPVYPPSSLARCPPPVNVRALLIVDANGRVADVRVGDPDGASADRRPYIDAVKAAAKQWSFVPLKIDRWAADANGESHVVDTEVRPFSLAYDFRFECHAGAAHVTSGDVPSAAGHGSE